MNYDPGTLVVYKIQVINPGNITALDAKLEVHIPTHLSFVESDEYQWERREHRYYQLNIGEVASLKQVNFQLLTIISSEITSYTEIQTPALMVIASNAPQNILHSDLGNISVGVSKFSEIEEPKILSHIYLPIITR